MVRLIAKPACDGLLPVHTGALSLTEANHEAVTLVAPFKGQEKSVSDALKQAVGAGFPAPGRALGKAGARLLRRQLAARWGSFRTLRQLPLGLLPCCIPAQFCSIL